MITGVSLEDYFSCDVQSGLWEEGSETGKASTVVQASGREACFRIMTTTGKNWVRKTEKTRQLPKYGMWEKVVHAGSEISHLGNQKVVQLSETELEGKNLVLNIILGRSNYRLDVAGERIRTRKWNLSNYSEVNLE